MKLQYHHYGSGEPVVILHGLFGLSDNWVTHAKRLAEKYSVFLPDLRNHGRSPHSPTFNYHAMADDIFEFIEDHELKNSILIGHSMGGKVAMQFALQNPDMVSKLIVIDISPVKYPDRDAHFDIISAMMSINFEAVHSREEVSEVLATRIPQNATRQFILKNLYRKTKTTFDWRLNLQSISNNMDLIFAGIESEESYDKPALFIKGERSDYIKEEHLPFIEKLFPNYELQSIKGAGHWIHVDAPDEVCTLFSNFLGKECTFQ